jgi:hypothetical protein
MAQQTEREEVGRGRKSLDQVTAKMEVRTAKKKEEDINRMVKEARREGKKILFPTRAEIEELQAKVQQLEEDNLARDTRLARERRETHNG